MSCAPANRLPPRLGTAYSHGGTGPGRGYCSPSLTQAIRGATWRSPGRQLRGIFAHTPRGQPPAAERRQRPFSHPAQIRSRRPFPDLLQREEGQERLVKG
jgi:hypothetical protein